MTEWIFIFEPDNPASAEFDAWGRFESARGSGSFIKYPLMSKKPPRKVK